MVQNVEKTKLVHLTELLTDGFWHSGEELSQKVSWRFGAAVQEARKKGYMIEKRRLENNRYEYRLSPSEHSDGKLQTQKLLDRIHLSTQMAGGRPTIRGRELTVEKVLELLASGATYDTLSTRYDWLEPEDIQACLLYSQTLVSRVRAELSLKDLRLAVPQILEKAPYIELIILFGSRARGNASRTSDWDIAFVCDEEHRTRREGDGMSTMRIWSLMQRIYGLKDGEIDVVDMHGCSELLAHAIVKDGKLIYEKRTGLFNQFREKNLLNTEQLKEIQEKDKAKIMKTIQVLRNESVRS